MVVRHTCQLSHGIFVAVEIGTKDLSFERFALLPFPPHPGGYEVAILFSLCFHLLSLRGCLRENALNTRFFVGMSEVRKVLYSSSIVAL